MRSQTNKKSTSAYPITDSDDNLVASEDSFKDPDYHDSDDSEAGPSGLTCLARTYDSDTTENTTESAPSPKRPREEEGSASASEDLLPPEESEELFRSPEASEVSAAGPEGPGRGRPSAVGPEADDASERWVSPAGWSRHEKL